MPTLHRDTTGVSVIIGSLLLVVIVVAAASAFALFTSQKQGEVQQAELLKTRRSLEDIKILTVTPTNNSTMPDNWTILNFTIASIYPQESTLIGFSLNDYQVFLCNITQYNISMHSTSIRQYNMTDFTYRVFNSNRTWGSWMNGAITLQGREQIALSINMSEDIFNSPSFPKTDIVKLEIITQYGNSFSRTFIPPDAIIKIDVESLPDGTSYYILDGSDSDHATDSYLVKWIWTIDNGTYPPFLYGRKAQVNPAFVANTDYTITLTVIDNYGMQGKSTFTLHA